MKTRGAVLFETPGRYEICNLDLDAPKQGEVLVRMIASGLCHSDVHFLEGDHFAALPMCAGHEGAGIVEQVGPAVTSVEPGDHVVLSFIPSCGRCRYCASGRGNLCDEGAKIQLGPQFDGTYRMHYEGSDVHQCLLISTFSNWSVVPAMSVVKIPKDVPFDAACLLGCGVGTGFGSATNAAQIRPGDTVIVMGVGGVGINAVQGAALCGAANVLAVDPFRVKRDLARTLGATETFASIEEAADHARALTDGQGADSAIVTMAGPDGNHVAQAFDAISKGGTVVVTGMSGFESAAGIPVNLLILAGYQKRIQGCLFGMCSPAVDILRQIDLYRSGRLKLDELITRRYPLADLNNAVDDLLEGRNVRGVVVHDH